MMIKNRTEAINYFIKKYKYNSYLEIGVSNGVNFSNIKVQNKTGVDPDLSKINSYIYRLLNEKENESYSLNKACSDDFFKENDKKFDIVFIDGLHHCEQVYKDVINSLRYLNAGGLLILHDCNPFAKFRQEKDGANGDVWKAFYFFTQSKIFDIFTIDCDQGLGVIKPKVSQHKVNEYINSINEEIPDAFNKDLNYNFLNSNREEVLVLTKPQISLIESLI